MIKGTFSDVAAHIFSQGHLMISRGHTCVPSQLVKIA